MTFKSAVMQGYFPRIFDPLTWNVVSPVDIVSTHNAQTHTHSLTHSRGARTCHHITYTISDSIYSTVYKTLRTNTDRQTDKQTNRKRQIYALTSPSLADTSSIYKLQCRSVFHR